MPGEGRASTSSCERGKTWMAGTSPAMTVLDRLTLVMPGEGRASTSSCERRKTWMAGTSPAMTVLRRLNPRHARRRPGIHVFLRARQDVDGRDKPGHDGALSAHSRHARRRPGIHVFL